MQCSFCYAIVTKPLKRNLFTSLQATTSGLGAGGHQQASLAEQARVAEGKRVEVETELKQFAMRESHLASEVKSGEKELSKKQGKHGTESAQERERKVLTDRMKQLDEQLLRLTSEDEAAGGNEASMIGECRMFEIQSVMLIFLWLQSLLKSLSPLILYSKVSFKKYS